MKKEETLHPVYEGILLGIIVIFSITRGWTIASLHQEAYALETLRPANFGMQMALLVVSSAIVVFLLPDPTALKERYVLLRNPILCYGLIICFSVVYGSFMFTSVFTMLLLSFPFSLELYILSLLLTGILFLTLIGAHNHAITRSSKNSRR